MGFLALGHPFKWVDSEEARKYVKEHGITQFLNVYKRDKNRENDTFLWGDEVEAEVVSIDTRIKNVSVELDTSGLFERMTSSPIKEKAKFLPEYGRFMIESTPPHPRTANVSDLTTVAQNMYIRRSLVNAELSPNERIIYFASFPRLGATTDSSREFAVNQSNLNIGGPVAKSLFLPDEITNPHVRFPTLTENIRARRGSKVAINVPIYKDINTELVDSTTPWNRQLWPDDKEAVEGAALPSHIYMDAMGFGMGCSALQVTYQASDIDQARTMTDSFVPLAPILLAASAAAPFFRGFIADVDARWKVISDAVDDRTEAERSGLIPKSRYDSISLYIANGEQPRLNSDIQVPIHEESYARLLKEGIDEPLARHIAHLFIRDPLVIFDDYESKDDAMSSDHFENIQSTNWQTVRFKPPTLDAPGMGWRVEFRPIEIQVTDIENAAFALFVTLFIRAVNRFKLNLYMPISQVDENMARAQKRDAIHTQKFYFPDSFTPDHSISERTLGDIVEQLAGLIFDLIDLDYKDDESARIILRRDIQFVVDRATGKLVTWAKYMRDFVLNHPTYRHDSVVPAEALYDLSLRLDDLEKANVTDDSLLPSWYKNVREHLGSKPN